MSRYMVWVTVHERHQIVVAADNVKEAAEVAESFDYNDYPDSYEVDVEDVQLIDEEV